MILEGSMGKFTSRPEMLRDFVYRISDSLRGAHQPSVLRQYGAYQQPSQAHSIRILSLEENGESQTMLRWTNASIGRTKCQHQKQLNDTLRLMMGAGKSGVERVRHDFRKMMGPQFHVRKVGAIFSYPKAYMGFFVENFKADTGDWFSGMFKTIFL